MSKKDINKTTVEIDINTIELEDLLIALGGVLYAGADIQEIDTPLLSRLEDLIIAEVLIRESGLIVAPPKGETMH